MLTVSTPSSAQDMTVNVRAFLSARPSPIGVGQEVLINLWMSPAPGANRLYHDYTLTITGPDGKSESYTFNSYVADGTMWMPFYPAQVGEYKLKFSYPGETFEAGRYFEGEIITGNTGGTVYDGAAIIKAASSPELTLMVQEEMVAAWPYDIQKPTDYWIRPVNEENRDWWPFIGGYPWFGPGGEMWDDFYPNTNPTYNSAYGFVPWVMGPTSAHIVWTRDYKLGGLMGGDFGVGSSVFPTTTGWGIKPDIVLMGRAYEAITKAGVNTPASQTYWRCFDIRTGEIIWERPLSSGEATPTLIEYGGRSGTVPGERFKPETPSLISISNGYLRKYDPIGGGMTLNVSIAPMTGSGGTYYMNGYVLGVQDLGADAGAERYRLINWTTIGSATNFADRIVSNTTYARSSLPTIIDWDVGLGGSVANVQQGGMFVAMDIAGYNLYTGETLWTKRITEQFYSASCNFADHGKLAVLSGNGYYQAYDLWSGNLVWQTETFDYPWDAAGWGSYSVTSAYGKMYWVAQTGIYAINWNTGAIEWKFEADAPPFETPYTGRNGQTVYPFDAAILIIDGKLYTYSSKHTPETPFYRGSPTVCIDAFTGDLVWQIGMKGSSEFGRGALQMSFGDGYMTLGARDGVMYTFGIGKSETTISASQTMGQSVLLTGSVLDMSPAQPGAQCVSKESVAALMEQIHMQAGIGGVYGNVMLIGVPVLLTATDSNGNSYNIATVTSDGYSGTFAYAWNPDQPGQYTVTATFMGDESYGSSYATTHIIVAAENSDSGTNNTLLYALIGATVAIIAVVVIVGFLILRKK
jgi:hypothetical protein